ncbi:protein BTG4-like [Engystomops pustulosus]|uniref:protein BTG4-like n=1 Tax=Engystomops pustulosus TaxID=76066 RepID=UPI003AFAA508
MREELLAGVGYIKTLANRFQKLDPMKINIFGDKVLEILSKKYTGHWYPEKPMRGQAYRCIRVNRHDREETILEACAHSGLSYQDLDLPKEMTLWIDPYEVSCRLGEDNYPYTVASFHPKKPRLPDRAGEEKVSSGPGPVTSSTPPPEDGGSTVPSSPSLSGEDSGIEDGTTTPTRPGSRNVEDPVSIPAPRAVFRTAAPLWIPGWRAPQFNQNSPEDHLEGFWKVQETVIIF